MNKNDFYKQIMSEYTFDADKIRENAKKGRFARQKISPLTIGITATVAAATVVCGTMAMTMMGGRNGVSLIDNNKPLAELSTADRVRAAIEQQNKAQNNDEMTDVLVTFITPMSPAAAEDILSSYTDKNVPVKTVYLEDGSKITGSEQIAAVFKGSNNIYAMAVQCAGSVMSQLQSDPSVYLVELVSEAELDTIVPIQPEDAETVEVNEIVTPPVVEPVTPSVPVIPETYDVQTDETVNETVQTESSETEGSSNTVDTSESAETAESIEPSESSEPTDESVQPDDVTTEPETSQPIQNETAESVTPAEPIGPTVPENPVTPVVPEVVIPTLPQGVTLPENPDRFVYDTVNYDIDSAFFVTNNVFYASNDREFVLYSFNGYMERTELLIECSEPRIHWIAENGGYLLVSANGENGNRNKLWLVDAYNLTATDLHAEDSVMDGTLVGVGYNAEYRTLVMNIKENGSHYICAYSLDTNGGCEYISIPFDSSAKTTIMTCTDKKVYLSVADGALTQIYAVDINSGEAKLLRTYDNNPKISKNLAFTHAIIAPSDSALTGNTEIFDPSTETFISTGYFNEKISFGASRHSFSVGDSYYTLTSGGISSAGGINTIAPIDYKKSFSSSYTASAVNGYVRITESSYTNDNKTALLTFGHITPNADGKYRNELNGAIGMNNALALVKCREAGITTKPLLLDSLSVYYSEKAIAQLKNQCNISDFGALNYTKGGLKAIRADETVLVISSERDSSASGMLYIKAGSFGGKTAYRSVNVNFVKENGAWKLDSILK